MKGIGRHGGSLSNNQIRTIANADRERGMVHFFAREYNVSEDLVRHVRRNRIWLKDIKDENDERPGDSI